MLGFPQTIYTYKNCIPDRITPHPTVQCSQFLFVAQSSFCHRYHCYWWDCDAIWWKVSVVASAFSQSAGSSGRLYDALCSSTIRQCVECSRSTLRRWRRRSDAQGPSAESCGLRRGMKAPVFDGKVTEWDEWAAKMRTYKNTRRPGGKFLKSADTSIEKTDNVPWWRCLRTRICTMNACLHFSLELYYKKLVYFRLQWKKVPGWTHRESCVRDANRVPLAKKDGSPCNAHLFTRDISWGWLRCDACQLSKTLVAGMKNWQVMHCSKMQRWFDIMNSWKNTWKNAHRGRAPKSPRNKTFQCTPSHRSRSQ